MPLPINWQSRRIEIERVANTGKLGGSVETTPESIPHGLVEVKLSRVSIGSRFFVPDIFWPIPRVPLLGPLASLRHRLPLHRPLADAVRAGLVFLVEQQRLGPAAEVDDLRSRLLVGRLTFEQPAHAILPQELGSWGALFKLGEGDLHQLFIEEANPRHPRQQ